MIQWPGHFGFDSFAAIVENGLPKTKDHFSFEGRLVRGGFESVTRPLTRKTEIELLQEARHIYFPGRAHEEIPTEGFVEAFGDILLGDNFLPPFQTMFVEDTASGVLIHYLTPDKPGVNQPFFFIECRSDDPSKASEYRGSSDEYGDALLFERHPQGSALITWGFVASLRYHENFNPKTDPCRFTAEIAGKRTVIAHKKHGILEDIDGELFTQSALCGGENAIAAVEELAWAQRQDRFVVERSSTKTRRRKKNGPAIDRSCNRAQYVLMTPLQFHETIGTEDEFNAEVSKPRVSHPRRAHWRYYRNPRYTKMQGKRQRIAATWIGPVEGVDRAGSRHYKVLLDERFQSENVVGTECSNE